VPDPNAFTGAALDRAGDARRRDAAWLAAQRAHPAARAVLASSAGLRVHDGALTRVPLAVAAAPADAPLLGLEADGPVFAVDEDLPAPDGGLPPLIGGGRRGAPPAADGERVALRSAGAVLSQSEGGLAAYAGSLLNWHRRHRFCANCGRPTDVGEGGLLRRCPVCGAQHHPRTDPVVIMIVTDGDRLLLGRQPSWPSGRYSALAGFVEPGEGLEEAVAREVREEAGVEVGPPRYVSSQPWPFPASLMLGFSAPWRSGDPVPGDEELEDVRWFSRPELAAATRDDDDAWGPVRRAPATPPGGEEPLRLPPRLAIARRLIEGWLSP
jgi:NAD+ diphosphatase